SSCGGNCSRYLQGFRLAIEASHRSRASRDRPRGRSPNGRGATLSPEFVGPRRELRGSGRRVCAKGHARTGTAHTTALAFAARGQTFGGEGVSAEGCINWALVPPPRRPGRGWTT